jgi:hypothetical protein
MNLLDGLMGGVRRLYARGVEQVFKPALDFADLDATVLSDRVSLTVAALQGVSVSATAPEAGDLLAYDAEHEQWAPAPGGLVDAAPADSLVVTYQADVALTASKVLMAGTGLLCTPSASTITIEHDPEALVRDTLTLEDLCEALATQGVITLSGSWPV